jgi:hypothetical protein
VGSANADLVRSILGAWGRGVLSSLEWADSQIEVVFANGPEPGSHVGLADMEARFRSWLGAFGDFRILSDDVIELDSEHVLAPTSAPVGGPT